MTAARASFAFFALLAACAPPSEPPSESDNAGIVDTLDATTFCGPGASGIETRSDGALVLLGDCRIVGRRSLGQMNTLGFDEVTGSLAVANGPDLEGAVFLTLQRVGGSLTSGGNRRLSTLEFPELREVGGNVEIVGNVGLVRFDFDSLTHVGLSLIVRSNPDLPACRPEDFFGGVVVGGPVVIEGNGVTCCVAP